MSEANETAEENTNRSLYWRANIKLLAGLLAIWFLVSLGAGIIFVDVLNKIEIAGFKLGFWFAQQGSILIFVVLIFVYAARMRVIERRFGVSDE
ncbi:MAG: membrane protein [Hyphococcus sp.]|nr:MAG: membrane protein [Marinicaulis sp.]